MQLWQVATAKKKKKKKKKKPGICSSGTNREGVNLV